MPRKPISPILNNYKYFLSDEEIDCAYPIRQDQLNSARLFSSREEYIKTLPHALKYMEIGVAWGYYSQLVAEEKNPTVIHLMDTFNQDLKCWSWRKFGQCQCQGIKHELLYTPETHEQYILNKFEKFNNVKTFKGDCTLLLKNIPYRYDYIYIDITNDRTHIGPTLELAANLIEDNGIIGLNDYLIYDGIIEDKPYSTFQVVNEFLMKNNHWIVDGLALHTLGFYDIYIKRVINNV
jgi:hypothetical protein